MLPHARAYSWRVLPDAAAPACSKRAPAPSYDRIASPQSASSGKAVPDVATAFPRAHVARRQQVIRTNSTSNGAHFHAVPLHLHLLHRRVYLPGGASMFSFREIYRGFAAVSKHSGRGMDKSVESLSLLLTPGFCRNGWQIATPASDKIIREACPYLGGEDCVG